MGVKKIEPYELLIEAGECFMFLLWSETVMRDLVVLKEGGDDMRRRYSETFGNKPHPSDFSKKRLELGRLELTEVKKKFLCHWPEWNNQVNVKEAIERLVIWRNALGHANVQPFRAHLLYTPNDASLNRINTYMKCHKCYNYYIDCNCLHTDLAEPTTLIVDSSTLDTIYTDIRTLDLNCFYLTAQALNVEYLGVAWATFNGQYDFKEHHRV